jgi:formamidopyrimidine-DNA glycosylase
MPELPEAEVVTGRLGRILEGRTIVSAQVIRQNGRYLAAPGDLASREASQGRRIIGSKVTAVRRRGKKVLVFTDGGTLECSLGMSGYWDAADDPWTFAYVEGGRKPDWSDVRVSLFLDDDKIARFHDARLFGTLLWHEETIAEDIPTLKKMGSDALATPLFAGGRACTNVLDLAMACSQKGKTIKERLTDQSRIAGVGNIYSVEALWWARISPFRDAGDLIEEEWWELWDALRGILTTSLGMDLSYAEFLNCYRKTSCFHCKHPIERSEIAKRATYWCPTCQE